VTILIDILILNTYFSLNKIRPFLDRYFYFLITIHNFFVTGSDYIKTNPIMAYS